MVRDKMRIHKPDWRGIHFAKAFNAGFISTLVFHQDVLTLFYLAGLIPRVPYDLGHVPPLGIPAVISLAFWGGLWGVTIWPLLKNVDGPAYWARALVITAVFPSLVGLFIVFPLKGMPMAGAGNPKVIVFPKSCKASFLTLPDEYGQRVARFAKVDAIPG